MPWKNTCFAFREIAELLKKELEEAGIQTGAIFFDPDNARYYVPWKAVGRQQYETALAIVCEHID